MSVFLFPMNFDIFWKILLWYRWWFCCFADVFVVLRVFFVSLMRSHVAFFIDIIRIQCYHIFLISSIEIVQGSIISHTQIRAHARCVFESTFEIVIVESKPFGIYCGCCCCCCFSFHVFSSIFLIALCFSAAYFCHLNCYKCLYLVCRVNRICKFSICYVRNYVKYEFNDWTECVLLAFFSFRFVQVLEQNDSIYTMSKFLLTVSSGNWLKVNSLCICDMQLIVVSC